MHDVEPALEDAIAFAVAGDDLENADETYAVASATVEISDTDKLERKPEEELFLLVDDDLDNDIVSSHAAAFHRVDPQLDPTSAAATSEALTPGKTSAAEGDVVQKTLEKTDADAVGDEDTAAAAKTEISEKASPKRLVFGAEWVRRRHSQNCECVDRYHFR